MSQRIVLLCLIALAWACSSDPVAAQSMCGPMSTPPVIKNNAPHAGTNPSAIAHVASTNTIYVTEFDTPETYRYDIDLNPLPPITTPAFVPGVSQITGITWEETMDILIWFDFGNQMIHHTDLMGTLISSFPAPTTTGTGLPGDIGTEKNWPTPPIWPPKTYWVRGADIIEIDPFGVPTGNVVTGPGGPTAQLSGISSRRDNRDAEVAYAISGDVFADKVTLSGALIGPHTCLLALQPPIRGIEFVLFGSDGQKSLFIISGGANQIIETGRSGRTNAFIRGDGNQDGTVDIADAIQLIGVIFGQAFVDCDDSADCNDDGMIDIGDPICVLNLLFSTPPIPITPPFPFCGDDTTADPLACGTFGVCP